MFDIRVAWLFTYFLEPYVFGAVRYGAKNIIGLFAQHIYHGKRPFMIFKIALG